MEEKKSGSKTRPAIKISSAKINSHASTRPNVCKHIKPLLGRDCSVFNVIASRTPCSTKSIHSPIINKVRNEPILGNSFDFLLIGASDCIASVAAWLSWPRTSLHRIGVAAVVGIFRGVQAGLDVKQRFSRGTLTIEALSTCVDLDDLCGISKRDETV